MRISDWSSDVCSSGLARLRSSGVGSTLSVQTARPFDFNGLKVSATLGGNYEENSKEASPEGSFLISDTFADDTFGILISASYSQRQTELQTAKTDGWLVNPDEIGRAHV